MKIRFLNFLVIINLFSCSTKENEESSFKKLTIDTLSKTSNNIDLDPILKKESNEKEVILNWDSVETMDYKEIILNGKHSVYFSLSEFKKNYGKPDSSKLVMNEDVCTSNFENDPESKYYYKNGSKFEVSKNKVVTEEFRFNYESYIIFKGIKLNKESTEEDLKKIFPYAMSGIADIDFYDWNDGTMQFISLKEESKGISDGHLRLFFKNKKLKFMHWWFPC